jgi:cation transporter-like permease
MILLLAPVASYVALFFSSTATWLVIYARQRAGTDPPTAVMSIVLCGPPLVTFLAMIGWALHVHFRNEPSRRSVR